MASNTSAPSATWNRSEQITTDGTSPLFGMLRPPKWRPLFWNLVLGLIVLSFNVDYFLQSVGGNELRMSWTGSVARNLGLLPSLVLGPLDDLSGRTDAQLSAIALSATLACVLIYCLIALGQSIRIRTLRILSASLLGIASGLVVVPLILWLPIVALVLWSHALVPVIKFVWAIANIVVHGFSIVINALVGFAGTIFSFMASFAWLESLLLIAAGGLLHLIWKKLPEAHPLRWIVAPISGFIMASGVISLMMPLITIIGRALMWLKDASFALFSALMEVVGPLFIWVPTVVHYTLEALKFVFIAIVAIAAILIAAIWMAVGILFLVALPGALLVDQFKVAWFSGQGQRGAFQSGFSLSAAIILIIMVSGGNLELIELFDKAFEDMWRIPSYVDVAHSFSTVWPPSLEAAVLPYLSASQAPLFDGVMMLAAGCISCIGMARLKRPSADNSQHQYALSFPMVIFTAYGVLLSLLIAAAMLLINYFGSDQ